MPSYKSHTQLLNDEYTYIGGSRKELIESGTYTGLVAGGAGNWQRITTIINPPVWSKSLVFMGRIDAINLGTGSALSFAGVRYDLSNEAFTTSAGAERGLEMTAIAAPTENNGVVFTVGQDVTAINQALVGTSYYSYPSLPLPKFAFSHNFTALPVSWTLRYYVYAVGN